MNYKIISKDPFKIIGVKEHYNTGSRLPVRSMAAGYEEGMIRLYSRQRIRKTSQVQ
jgi:hypothetical protein